MRLTYLPCARALLVVTALLILAPLMPRAQAATAGSSATTAAEALAPFTRFIGGRWQLGNSYQEYRWGLDKQSVQVSGFVIQNGQPRMVSQGHWYWHPGEKQIRGMFFAVDMPVWLFDYQARFTGNTLKASLTAYDKDNRATRYQEHWRFSGPDSYQWQLFSQNNGQPTLAMDGQFTRVMPPAP